MKYRDAAGGEEEGDEEDEKRAEQEGQEVFTISPGVVRTRAKTDSLIFDAEMQPVEVI